MRATLAFNSRLQLQSLAYAKGTTKLLELAYGYTQNGGNNGQITSITDSTGTQEAGRTVNYTYDAWARLKTAQTSGSTQYPQWGLSWDYDRYGNRKGQNVTAGSGPSNAVTPSATTNRITDAGYAYDAAGNMTSDGVNTLVYDAESRVVSSTAGGATANYTLDGNGLRVKKISGGTTTVYIFAGSKVIAEYDDGVAPNSPTREYVYAGSQLVATVAGGATKYHHADHLSMRVTSDSTGGIVASSGHFPFGENWYESGGTSKLKFTSYERDSESSNDYAMFRTHVNRLGRFSSPDPIAGSIADPQSLNRYAYTRNDPVNLVDPLGLWPWSRGSSQDNVVIMLTGRGWTMPDNWTALGIASMVTDVESRPDGSELGESYYNVYGNLAVIELFDLFGFHGPFGEGPRQQGCQGPSADATPQSATAEGSNVVVTYTDGTQMVRSGGSRSWRNNNPGNIRSGAFASGQGAIGVAGGFAVFPNAQTGQSAIVALLSTPSYQNLSVSEALSRYAPPNENDTAAYQQFVQDATGISGQTRMSTLNNYQIQSVANAIRRIEGWSPGTENCRRQ